MEKQRVKLYILNIILEVYAPNKIHVLKNNHKHILMILFHSYI